MIMVFCMLFGCESKTIIKERTLIPCDDCHQDAEMGDDWIPIWCDEFDGELVDLDKWNMEDSYWPNGDTNGELQYYSPNNIFVEDGKLIIEARKEVMSPRNFTSGRMNSKDKGDWLYGRAIVRAKMPLGAANWPGIWMLPTENIYGNWPHSGEIDIAEYFGWDTYKVHGYFHTSKYNWIKNNHIGGNLILSDTVEAFHNYEMIWEPGRINLFVDEEPLATYTYTASNEQNVNYSSPWPFDQKFHMVLNLAISEFGGMTNIDEVSFPTRFEIDYVRYYQRDYPYIDVEVPKPIQTIYKGQSIYKSLIYWDIPEDDYEIEYYEIYINDVLHGTSPVNSFIIKGLFPKIIYRLQVVAVDFAGHKSEFQTPMEYSY